MADLIDGPVKIVKLEDLNSLMIGGNHLASSLIHLLGASEKTFPPYTADIVTAFKTIKDPIKYDLWVCWANIMKFRDIYFGGPNDQISNEICYEKETHGKDGRVERI